MRGLGIATAVLAIASCGRIGFSEKEVAAQADAAEPVEMLALGEGDSDVSGVTTDSSIQDFAPDENCGRCDTIFSGNAETGLLRFDLSAVPPGATIVGAEVGLWLSDLHTLGGQVDIHEILEAWDGGDEDAQAGVVNWTERQPGVSWSTAGARGSSRSDAPLATFVPESIEVEHGFALPPGLVSRWIASPDTNYGIGVFGRDYPGDGSDHPHFVSSENTDQPSRRPVLRLYYRP